MKLMIFDFPLPSSLGQHLRDSLKADKGEFTLRSFPDGESYLRLGKNVKNRHVIVNASLYPPNDVIVPLLFFADTLRTQGAKTVGLLASYLPYMRQDKVFHPGEALTSLTFAKMISQYFDYLVTVDPHLHRYHSLSEIYSIPTYVVHTGPLLATWIRENISNPFIIGPDAESLQWIKEVSKNFPFLILNKKRYADKHVEITWPEGITLEEKTPVLVDDIISSGGTMLQAIEHLNTLKTKPPICLVIHPLFAENSYQELLKAGAQTIVSCNSLPHLSNQIDLAPLIAPVLDQIHKNNLT